MSYLYLRSILKQLNFHPQKLTITQQLLPRDYVIRMEFTQTMLEMQIEDIVTLTSDKAQFHLSGFVNKQNSKNPRYNYERPLHYERATVGRIYPSTDVSAGDIELLREAGSCMYRNGNDLEDIIFRK